MKKSVFKSLATAASIALGSIGAHALAIGEKAPAFAAPSTRGMVNLADYLGRQNVVLAFYYADFTPT